MINKEINIFSLSSSRELTEKICHILKVAPKKIKTVTFADGEILVQPEETVRGKEIYVIQSTNQPVNDNIMELLIAVDAFKRASAEKINVVIPYYGYARQDRKAKGRQPITSRLVANLLEAAGVHRVLVVDIHSAQTIGFFNIPSDNLSTAQVLAKEIINTIIKAKYNPEDCILISPDNGGLKRVHSVGTYTGQMVQSIGVIAKRRLEPNVAKVEFILGEVKNKVCFVIDDMIDTGGTIVAAANSLKQEGAKEVYVFAVHGLFNGSAVEKFTKAIEDGVIKSVVVTDTIAIKPEKQFPGLKIVSIAELIAQMISTSINHSSLTSVYEDNWNKLKEVIDNYVNHLNR